MHDYFGNVLISGLNFGYIRKNLINIRVKYVAERSQDKVVLPQRVNDFRWVFV
jgi:hypothetical protein